MRKVLAAAMFLGLASVSQAAFIQCTPSQSDTTTNGAVATSTFTCSGVGAAAGNQIQIVISDSFNDNTASAGTVVSVIASTSGLVTSPTAGAFVIGTVSCTATATAVVNPPFPGQAVGACTSSTVTSGALSAAVNSFTIQVSGAKNGANQLPFNSSASVSFQVLTGTPEPTSMVLLGSGFLALGLGARLRRKNRA